jgi:hypothetical protein
MTDYPIIDAAESAVAEVTRAVVGHATSTERGPETARGGFRR